MEPEGTIIPTRRLVAFLAVLEYGGVSRAAERLGVSPADHLRADALAGARRRHRAVRARPGRCGRPPAGTALRAPRRALLRARGGGGRGGARADRDARRHLSIAAGEALATHVLPPAVSQLRERLPGLTVEFVVGDEARVVEALRAGEVDAALLTDRTEARDLDDARLRAGPPGAGRRAHAPAGRPAAHRAGATWPAQTLVVRDAGTVNRREVEQMLHRRRRRAARPPGGVVAWRP